MKSFDEERRTFLLLLLIIISAFILRVWGVNFGLPGLFHVDERVLPPDAFYALTHSGRVLVYGYGNLISYLLAGFYSFYYVILKIVGVVGAPFDFLVLYMKDPSNIYLIGRMFIVISSTFCVFAMYLAGKSFYNRTVGFLSASLLAFAFFPIQHSKYMKGDNIGILLLLLSFYYCLGRDKSFSDKLVRKYVLSGIFMGLAIAARFSLCVSPVALIFLCFTLDMKFSPVQWREWLKRGVRNSLVLGMSGIVAFLITTPSLVFEFQEFISVLQIARNFTSTQQVATGNQSIWLFYLVECLRKGIGFPLWIAGLFGVLYSLSAFTGRFKRIHYGLKIGNKEDLCLIIFLVSYWGLFLNDTANYERYLAPVVPFFLLFAAKFIYLVSLIISRWTFRDFSVRHNNIVLSRTIIILLSIWCIAPNLANTMKYNHLITSPDTRNLARDFITRTVPAGTKIVSEGIEQPIGITEGTSGFGVQLYKSKEQLREQLEKAHMEGREGNFILAMIEGQNEPTYEVENVYILEAPYGEQYSSVDPYIEAGVEYLITCSWVRNQWYGEPSGEFLNSLKVGNPEGERYEFIKEFVPNPVFRWDPWCWRVDYNALSKISIFRRNTIGGPIIKLYKKRK